MPDNAPLTMRRRSIQDGLGGQKVTEVVLTDSQQGRTLLRSPGWPTEPDDRRVARMLRADRLYDRLVGGIRTALAALDDPRKETSARRALEAILEEVGDD